MSEIKKYDIIEIKWLDAHHTSGWMCETEIDWKFQEESFLHLTVGYFIKKTKTMIAVAQSFRELPKKSKDEGVIDSLMKIPLKAIIKIKRL